MRAIAIGTGAVLVFLIAAFQGAGKNHPAPAALGHRSRLFKDSREKLALQLARGEVNTLVVIASTEGQNTATAAEVARLGGTIEYRDDDVSYLFARVPTDRVGELSECPSIEAADLDEIVPYQIGRPGPPEPFEGKPLRPAPGKNIGDDNLYLDAPDTGAPKFRAEHPTFDGRGVTIALIDAGVDPFLPELQTAKTLEGTTVKKVADYVSTDEPGTPGHPGWVDMKHEVAAAERKVVHGGTAYITPANKQYRIGVFRAKLPVAVPAGTDFGVLWDESTGTVWVDTNQNHDFSDEKPMMEYRYRQDVGVFGKDDPSKPVRGTFPFVVELRPDRKYVRLTFESGAHGTMMCGCATGKGFFGSAASSPAPEARLVMIYWTPELHALVKGMIKAAKDPSIDVVNIAAATGANRYPLRDGRSTAGIVVTRLAEKYDKLFIGAAGNRFGMTTVMDYTTSPRVLGVSGYISKHIFEMNYGAEIPMNGMQIWTTGPAGSGALKPDVLAPTGGVTTYVGWRHADGRRGVYELPTGYAVFGGTSNASCTAAGSVAALISAAKQSHIRYTAETLKRAITAGARYVPEIAAYRQGNGVIDIPAAWEKLKQLSGVAFDEIETTAPVKTSTSSYLVPPDQGPGLYEREGWAAGQRGTRTVRFKRTLGTPGPVTYRIAWVGNDGSFGTEESITLPLNRSVDLAISVAPKVAGAHSAILRLVQPGLAVPAHQVLVTVVAAEPFTAENHYTVERSIQVNRPGDVGFFVAVPGKASALRLDWDQPDRLDLTNLDPSGGMMISDYMQRRMNGEKPLSHTRAFAGPPAGAYEVLVENWRDIRDYDPKLAGKFLPVSARITASVLGVDVKPARDTVTGAKLGQSFEQEFQFANGYAPLTNPSVTGAIGSARELHPTIAAGHQQTFDIHVPEGSTTLSVRIGSAADPNADLDLYLFECTTGVCQPRGESTTPGSDESVDFDHPAAGTWKVTVDAFQVSTGATAYDYADFYTNPRFGSVTVPDGPNGQMNWHSRPSFVVANLAEPGRFLQGAITVQDDSSESLLWVQEPAVTLGGGSRGRILHTPLVVGSASFRIETKE